jgi:uncharacterized protein (DUF4415 family)
MKGKRSGLGRTLKRKSDDAPELTAKWAADANLYRGSKLIRRGRPKLESPRRLLSLRLPPDVIASWKASGPGWQTRMATVLEKSIQSSRRTAG